VPSALTLLATGKLFALKGIAKGLFRLLYRMNIQHMFGGSFLYLCAIFLFSVVQG
jgi:hypothetical protein